MKKKIAALVVILLAGAGLYFAYRSNEAGPPAPVTSEATFAELWASEGSGNRNQESGATAKATAKAKTTAAPPQTTAAAPKNTAAAQTAAAQTASQQAGTKEPDALYAFAGLYEGIAPQAIADPGDNYLILVSRESALPQGYSGRVKLASCAPGSELQLESTAASHYRGMYEAGQKDGVTLTPYSGYRSTQRQKNNFENKIKSFEDQGKTRGDAIQAASQSIQPPGCSEHEAGLAMDIVSTNANFADTKEYKWLVEHAHEYGFILRYPKDKTSVTLIKYEPWHWRYVGAEHAAKMKQSGQVLEQYLGVK